jgi:RNA polymerase sigma-70 factor (ECF subfamily)
MFDVDPIGDAPVEASLAWDHGHDRATNRILVRQELVSGYIRYRAMALRQLRDAVAADDVVQAFTLKALERVDQLRDPKAVHSWLRRLFQTTLIDFCRRRSTRRQREVSFELDLHDRALEGLTTEATDPAKTIGAALTRLKKEYADVICRLDLRDQPREEAADALGITVNNLTVRAHRARRALRDALDVMPISARGVAATVISSRCAVGHGLAEVAL